MTTNASRRLALGPPKSQGHVPLISVSNIERLLVGAAPLPHTPDNEFGQRGMLGEAEQIVVGLCCPVHVDVGVDANKVRSDGHGCGSSSSCDGGRGV